jgi:hypothetical protein
MLIEKDVEMIADQDSLMIFQKGFLDMIPDSEEKSESLDENKPQKRREGNTNREQGNRERRDNSGTP